MNHSESMSGTHGCGGDAAAYVLGALEPPEVQAFERHLEDCAVCRDEVAALQRVAQALPMAAPQYQAPSGLRRRVLRAVREDTVRPPTQARRRGLSSGMPAWIWRGVVIAGACAAIALAVFVGLDLSTGSGVQVIRASVTGISGSASVRLSGGRGELIVRHLSPPPPGDIYQLWLQRPHSAPTPTNALFSVSSAGAGEVGLPPRLHGVSKILVTPEPRGGSRSPTHSPVIVAPLS